MSWPATTHAFAIACGVGGAFVDVSEFVLFNEGDVGRSWGQPSPFAAVRPGTFEFTLDNSDGRFTPGNTAVLATPLVEGMAVCWQLNDRLLEGSIRRVRLLWGDVANEKTARVRIECDDVLGLGARTRFSNVEDQLEESAGLLARWRLDEPAGAGVAADSGPFGLQPLVPSSATSFPLRFGEEPLPWSSNTQLAAGDFDTEPGFVRTERFAQDFGYPSGQGGAYSFWMTVNEYTADFATFFYVSAGLNGGHGVAVTFKGTSSGVEVYVELPRGSAFSAFAPFPTGLPVYVSVVVDISGADQRARLYLDGVLAATVTRPASGTSSLALSLSVLEVRLASSGSLAAVLISRITHTLARPSGEAAVGLQNLPGLFDAINAAVPDLNINASTSLWNAPIAGDEAGGSSALAVLNEALDIEQGYIYPETSGTLTSPTTELVVRERTRPETVDFTFITTEDIVGAPVFGRDLNDTVSAITVNGPTASVLVTAPELRPLVGDASTSTSSLLQFEGDLRLWGQDRLRRGTNDAVDVYQFTVDARGTDTDRWSDLLAARPGDRIQVDGLPEQQLGFTSFDGWLIGGSEVHTPERNLFTFRLARTLVEARFDTDRFMASGELTLVGAINSAVTSFSVATTGARLSTTDEPYDIQIDNEVLTVTNCTTATPQVLTVTRGVGGTSAAAHSAGAVIVSTPDSLFGF